MISTKMGRLPGRLRKRSSAQLPDYLCITCAIVCVIITHLRPNNRLSSYNGRTCPEAGSHGHNHIGNTIVNYRLTTFFWLLSDDTAMSFSWSQR